MKFREAACYEVSCYDVSFYGACGRGSMVELELPKLTTRVRFPSPAPRF